MAEKENKWAHLDEEDVGALIAEGVQMAKRSIEAVVGKQRSDALWNEVAETSARTPRVHVPRDKWSDDDWRDSWNDGSSDYSDLPERLQKKMDRDLR